MCIFCKVFVEKSNEKALTSRSVKMVENNATTNLTKNVGNVNEIIYCHIVRLYGKKFYARRNSFVLL